MIDFNSRLDVMRWRDQKMDKVRDVLGSKYNYFSYVMIGDDNKYDIELDVYSEGFAAGGGFVLRHTEPAEGFPSDHLMTKLLLIAG